MGIFDEALSGIQQRLSSFTGPQAKSPFGGGNAVASPFKTPATPGSPFGGIGGVASPFTGNGAVPSPFRGQQGVPSPFGGQFSVRSPFGGQQGLASPFGGNAFSGFAFNTPSAIEAAGKAQQQQNNGGNNTTPGSGSGVNFDGPTTAADNANLNGAAIDAWVAKTRPGSPLAGMGNFILQEANARNISVPQLMGIMLLESGLGTEQGTLPGVYNYGGLTGSGWDGQVGNTTGMARAFAMFNSKEAGIRALIANLDTKQYRGLSLQQQTALWYLGNKDASLDSSDENANASLRQYLDVIGSAYSGLGAQYNPTAAPTQRPNNAIPGNSGQAGSMSGITPGVGGAIMQEFGPTDYARDHPSTYAYGNAYGLAGSQHPGVDWAVPRGTRVASPLGGTVSVVGNDHGTGYYYTDTTAGGARDNAGEYAVTLDNGDVLILGHMQRIDVRVGQRINAGDFIGLSGGSDGDHVHVEYRRKNANGGYTIVDPRQYLK